MMRQEAEKPRALYRGARAHPDYLHLRDGVPDEDGRHGQDPVAEDQHPGLVRRQPPQELEQHGGGGGDGAAAAPGRNRCAPSLHHLCLSVHLVCTVFDLGLLIGRRFTLKKKFTISLL